MNKEKEIMALFQNEVDNRELIQRRAGERCRREIKGERERRRDQGREKQRERKREREIRRERKREKEREKERKDYNPYPSAPP